MNDLQTNFENVLRKLPDDMFKEVLGYIESGKKFIKHDLGKGGGFGCIVGVIMGAHLSDTIFGSQRYRNYVESDVRRLCHLHLVDYNNIFADDPIMYRTILKIAEERGLKKLERVSEQIVSTEIVIQPCQQS